MSLSQDNRFSITLESALGFIVQCFAVSILLKSLPVNFDCVHVEILFFDKIKIIVNQMLSILSEDILRASSLRLTSMPGQVKILVGCYTGFSKLTKKTLLCSINLRRKWILWEPFQKCRLYLGRHLENRQFVWN